MKLIYGTKNTPKYEMFIQKSLLFAHSDVLIEDVRRIIRQYLCAVRSIRSSKIYDGCGDEYRGIKISETINEQPTSYSSMCVFDNTTVPHEIAYDYARSSYKPDLHIVSKLEVVGIYYGVWVENSKVCDSFTDDYGLYFIEDIYTFAKRAFCGVLINNFCIDNTKECVEEASKVYMAPREISKDNAYSLKDAFGDKKLKCDSYMSITYIIRELYPSVKHRSFPMFLAYIT